MATLAELELELGRERRMASRESRRARCLPATKPPKLSRERQDQLCRLAAAGEPVRELGRHRRNLSAARAHRLLALADPAAISKYPPGGSLSWQRGRVDEPRLAHDRLLDALAQHCFRAVPTIHIPDLICVAL